MTLSDAEGAVLGAALGVFGTGQAWPDLLVAGIMERWSVPWGGARASGPPVAVPVGGDWRAAAQAGQRDDRGEDTSEDSVVARWELDVDVQGHGGWRAVIVERVTAAEQLTCRAPGLGTVRVPEVVTWSPLRA